jgi:hypothetical protein
VVGKVAGNRDVAIVYRMAANRSEAREELNIAVRLSVIFIAGDQ